MKKLIKLNLKEAKYDTRLPNKLIGCSKFSSTMASKEQPLRSSKPIKVPSGVKKSTSMSCSYGLTYLNPKQGPVVQTHRNLATDKKIAQHSGQLMSDQTQGPGTSSEKLLKTYHVMDA
ncbi:hypothetical protein KY290_021134 [Solanum tuberosum]|uniref:Uncharacterized protein n=1 Tax=Solanum tuberosum TaxID=4113 RepID=A0ABQ7V2N7_SOLTU|nr:hypothetical protein KY289_020305 [Solanum tuberosum]KAH0692968.1 hypothetical protein KY285_020065 [Solanum tuberosum]KAH0757641.1 hypothetical protein KY290_021134 [Solanum tuberosum]